MEGQTSSRHLWLVSSKPEIESHTSADQIEASVRVDEPGLASGDVLHRRYTVTVQPDGSELIDDIEEWVTHE
jgi:hypothetical protein